METLKEAFYAKYPNNHRILGYFEDANNCECTWENITKVRLQKYVTFLQSRLSPNSVKTYCARLKTVLTEYNEEHLLPKGYNKILLFKADACQNVYLTNEEIKQVIKYDPPSFAESVIKNWFLLGCLTGARHSDYIRFTASNIHDGQLHYVSVKTHTRTSVPVSDFIIKLIRENNDKRYSEVSFTDVYFNRILKRVCKGAGVNEIVSVYTRGNFYKDEKWKFVASHTARRSYATNLYKQGVDLYTISRLCGHSSIEMTKQYICCGPTVDNSVLDYLSGFN